MAEVGLIHRWDDKSILPCRPVAHIIFHFSHSLVQTQFALPPSTEKKIIKKASPKQQRIEESFLLGKTFSVAHKESILVISSASSQIRGWKEAVFIHTDSHREIKLFYGK